MAAQPVPIPRNGETKRKWQDIAYELSREQDPAKVMTLCHELNGAMLEEERLKTQQRLGLVPTKGT